jgi:hypothetical protein
MEKYCNVLNKVFKDSLTSQEWISKKNEKVKVSIHSGCVDFISDNLAHQAAKVLKIENLTLIESHPGIQVILLMSLCSKTGLSKQREHHENHNYNPDSLVMCLVHKRLPLPRKSKNS